MPDYLIELFGNISQQLGVHLPRIVGATLILLVGWVMAHYIARTLKYAVSKAGVGNQLAIRFGWAARRGTISAIVGKTAFYLVMIFALVAFFNTLSLPIVSEPLNGLLKQVFEFSPRMLCAIVIGFAGWVLARAAKEGARNGIAHLHIDERIAAIGTEPSLPEQSTLKQPSETIRLSDSLPEAVYWLVLLLFLPALLGTLQLDGLLQPIQSMFKKGMDYIPNVLGAAFLFLAGLFIARIVRRVVSNLIASLGVDRLATQFGIGNALSPRKLSMLAGSIAYGVVLLPILVAALNTLDIDAVTQPVSQVLEKILSFVPGILGATLIVGISYVIGTIVSGLVSDLLPNMGFNHLPANLGIAFDTNESKTPSKIAGQSVFVLIMLLATMQALPMLGLNLLAEHLTELVALLFQLILGCTIIAVGIFIANFASRAIKASGIEQAERLALAAQVAIVIFAGATGLQRMGLAPSIVSVAFTTLCGGLGLAAAIAFGWGGRDAAKRIIDRYIR